MKYSFRMIFMASRIVRIFESAEEDFCTRMNRATPNGAEQQKKALPANRFLNIPSGHGY